MLLYRHSLRLTSGAGQLIRMQARGLAAAGYRVRVACRRGGLGFGLRTRMPVRYVTAAGERALAAAESVFVVDHSLRVPDARIVFVHNLATEASRHLGGGADRERERERVFFARLRPDARIVANSELVKRALARHFDLPDARIVVHHPGFDASRFRADALTEARRHARAALGIEAGQPVIGFVTSGDFHKRGLDVFLESAARIARARPDARFLVVGSKRLPDAAARHALFASGRAAYRPKDRHPERWMAALDVFSYAARFEEFGMVVAEALACGVPVLTSRRVGAAECLPEAYAPWLLDAPDAEGLAANALALLEDADARAALRAAGIERAADLRERAYVEATVGTIRACIEAGAG